MSESLKIKARARRAAETCCAQQAKPVRRLLLATGRDRAPILPEIVQIESTNICNAKCVFCPRDEMHRKQGIMSFELFRKIVDECAELGITHVRMHNYGEAFIDRQARREGALRQGEGHPEVGMISNGSLITEQVARGMIDAGLDAINISVDASGKEVFEATRIGLKYDKVIANIERLVRLRAESGKRRPKLILSFVRQNNSADEQAFIEHWRNDRRQDPHHRPAQLGRHAEHRIRRELSLLPALADLHRPLGRPGVALLRGLRRPDDPGRPEHLDHRGHLERRAYRDVRRRAPRERRSGHLPGLRSSAQRLPSLGDKAHLSTGPAELALPVRELAWPV